MFRPVLSRSFSISVSTIRPLNCRQFLAKKYNKDVNWKKHVDNFTPDGWIKKMRDLDAQFANLRMELKDVPKEIPLVEWKTWEEGIGDKNLVDQIKSEYENQHFETPQGLDLTQINASLDTKINQAKRSIPICEEAISELQSELIELKNDQKNVYHWTPIDFSRKIPGSGAQTNHEFMNGHFMLTPAEEEFMELDFSELQKQWEKSKGQIQAVSDLPLYAGYWSLDEEVNKAYERLEKLYSGTDDWQDIKSDFEKRIEETFQGRLVSPEKAKQIEANLQAKYQQLIEEGQDDEDQHH